MLYLQIINTITVIFIILFCHSNRKTKKYLDEREEKQKEKYKDQVKFRDEMLENQRKILDLLNNDDK